MNDPAHIFGPDLAGVSSNRLRGLPVLPAARVSARPAPWPLWTRARSVLAGRPLLLRR